MPPLVNRTTPCGRTKKFHGTLSYASLSYSRFHTPERARVLVLNGKMEQDEQRILQLIALILTDFTEGSGFELTDSAFAF